MGFFDKMLRAMGFQDEESEEKKEKNREADIDKKEEKIVVNSKFNLKNMQEDVLDDFDKIIKPKNQYEIEEIANLLLNGKSVKVDFIDFVEIDKTRALDFLSGVIFVLNGNIEKIEKTIYLFKIDKK